MNLRCQLQLSSAIMNLHLGRARSFFLLAVPAAFARNSAARSFRQSKLVGAVGGIASHAITSLRGGEQNFSSMVPARNSAARSFRQIKLVGAVGGIASHALTSLRGGEQNFSSKVPQYETRAQPAPGSPFHYAFPVQ